MKKRITFGKNTPGHREYLKKVRSRVDEYFANRKKTGNYKLKIITLLLLLSFATELYIIYVKGPMLPAWIILLTYVATGITWASIGANIMHEGSHGTFSSKVWVNDLAASILLLYVGGIPDNWRVMHVRLHHPNTNIYGVDHDVSTAETFLRFIGLSPWKNIHKYQKYGWYIFILYCQMTLNWVIATDIKQTKRFLEYGKKGYIVGYPNKYLAWIKVFLAKMFVILFWIILPIYLGINWWIVALGFFLMHQTTGMILSHIFQPAHVNEYTMKYHESDTIPYSNQIHQFVTSTDFATNNKLLTYFTGGLNMQKPHHMFPNISYVYYGDILQIMKEEFEEIKMSDPGFNLSYIEFPTFWSAIHANYRYVKTHSENRISFEV